MRTIGLDYGKKRVGMAVSDEEKKLAFPKKTIINTGRKNLLREIAKTVSEENIAEMVIGLPVTFSGKDSTQTKDVKDFIEDLRNFFDIPIHAENEIFTSKLAEENSPLKTADSSAAALILQSYLDKTAIINK